MRLPSTPTPVSFCLMNVGGRHLALPLLSIGEILPMATLVTPSGLPEALEGFLNLSGTAVPVLRMARLLGLDPVVIGLYTPLVVTRDAARPLALLVDRVIGIDTPEAVAPIDDRDLLGGCVVGHFAAKTETVHVLSLERLLDVKERQRLDELAVAAEARLHQFGLVAS